MHRAAVAMKEFHLRGARAGGQVFFVQFTIKVQRTRHSSGVQSCCSRAFFLLLLLDILDKSRYICMTQKSMVALALSLFYYTSSFSPPWPLA
jgi:hypothetical protein